VADEAVFTVGIGEMKVGRAPHRLLAVGLGSCVAVAMVDRDRRCGGMAHVMLPFLPKRVREGANLLKYADHALIQMVTAILGVGGRKENLVAKMCGGANMFGAPRGDLFLDVGSRNVEAVRRKLAELAIPLVAEETGGHQGRSVELSLETGQVKVRSLWKEIKVL
jgi:chemotaxis protein CheD